MKRQVKTLILVAASLATLSAAVNPAVACDRRRGSYGGFGGFSRPTVYRRSPGYTTYSLPRQSTYSQPRVIYSQPQPVSPSSIPNQPQPVFSQSAVQPSAPTKQPQSAPQQNVPPRQISNAPTAPPAATSSAARVADPSTQKVANQAPAKTAEASALQMLASVAAGSTSVAQSAVQQASATTPSIPQFAPAPSSQTHVGTWKVNLPNSQSVELQLQGDGKFAWTAVSKGNRKAFTGQYRLDEGRLTLVRSGDLQQMSGSWTGSNDQFTFKLDGSNNGGLKFQRG